MFFTREDWKLFRNLDSLSQKAGVSQDRIPALVAKELVDNALDVSDQCECKLLDGCNGFYVQDYGPGLDVNRLSEFFSINRPLVSSKLLRLPTRGALGNGLRVVTGAVVATGGQLYVSTKGGRYELVPLENGETAVNTVGVSDNEGTRVDVVFGSKVKFQEYNLSWAHYAILYADGQAFSCKTSPFWYTSDAFYELVNAYDGSITSLAAMFEGISRQTAKMLSGHFEGQTCNLLTFAEADHLLGLLREFGKNVTHKRLGYVGDKFSRLEYVRKDGLLRVKTMRGEFDANIPYVVEGWVRLETKSTLKILVNKTPITGVVEIYDDRHKISVFGCGLSHSIKSKTAQIVLNIQTPYMPITSDGKEPNLKPMLAEMADVITKAAKKAKKLDLQINGVKARNEKEIILEYLDDAMAKASGDGEYKFSQRQLYYAIRPYVIQHLGKQPDYNYFCRIITEYEAEYGDIPNIYRDPRGILYHPHLAEEIPVGTISVERYQRPAWTFNKILYSEKEGFFSILKDAKFPERYDCALLTSKGYASRAVKDLFDLLGDTDEEILFFCIHDADAAGTKIYETLQEGTLARPGRRVKVINLGLEPEEALKMGLEPESCESKSKKPVADYVNLYWRDWLQDNRVELNAMTSPQFLQWLERKIERYGNGKLVPDTRTIQSRLKNEVVSILERKLAAKILREAGFEEKLAQAIQDIAPGLENEADSLRARVAEELEGNRECHWTEPVKEIATEMTRMESA